MLSDTIINKTILQNVTESAAFSAFFNAAIHNSLPVAMWKMPNQKSKTVIADLSGSTTEIACEIEKLSEGFIVNPFQNEGKSHYINADIFFRSGNQEIKENLTNEFCTEKETRNNQFINTLTSFLKGEIVRPKIAYSEKAIYNSSKESYLQLVEKSVQEIKNREFDKVVTSRAKTIDLPKNFNLVSAFEILCEAYPTTFVSLHFSPKFGFWLGATPETLISVDEKAIFRTIALAGTQAKSNFPTISEASWTQKEIEEQALVSRYIINCFKKIRLREFEEEGPKTVAAGTLLHLCTSFKVDTKSVNFPNLGNVMLELLHPTSAVCGMPKEAASDFIQSSENYDRELYSGFLGVVNSENQTAIFVNLRCMQVLGNQAILYAGGGITRDSKAEKEWKETEMKMAILGNVLF